MLFGFSQTGHAAGSAVPDGKFSEEMGGDLENAVNGSNLGGNPTDGSGRAKDSPVSSWKSYFKFPMMDKRTKIFAVMVLGSVAALSTVGAGSRRRLKISEVKAKELKKNIEERKIHATATYTSPEYDNPLSGPLRVGGASTCRLMIEDSEHGFVSITDLNVLQIDLEVELPAMRKQNLSAPQRLDAPQMTPTTLDTTPDTTPELPEDIWEKLQSKMEKFQRRHGLWRLTDEKRRYKLIRIEAINTSKLGSTTKNRNIRWKQLTLKKDIEVGVAIESHERGNDKSDTFKLNCVDKRATSKCVCINTAAEHDVLKQLLKDLDDESCEADYANSTNAAFNNFEWNKYKKVVGSFPKTRTE